MAVGLIGRKRELAAAEKVFAALPEGPRAISIAGEPGIGKTRLLTELGERADAAGRLALGGRGAEFERDLPFGVFADALDDYLASQGARRFAALGPERLGELGQVFPSLAGLGDPPSGAQDERYRTHAAVRELLSLLAAGRGLVLALDDLHWIDSASAELVAHLLRRPPEAPVCLLLAHRPGQLSPALAAAIEDADRDGLLTRIDVSGLGRHDAEPLLADLDPGDRDRLYGLSGGNPFYLEELARSGGRAEGPAQSAGFAGVEVPERVASALARELQALPGPIAEVARGAAVVGEAFEPELAAEAAGVSERDALTAMDDLLDLDLIRQTDVPRRFRFRHPIVHSAVYESAKPGWRLQAHARVAALFERRGESALARARHVECSAKPGDDEAIAVLTEAGRAAHPRAPAAAAHWYETALRLVPEADVGRRLGLMVPMAQALAYAGLLEQARASLEELLALIEPEQLAIRGRVVASAAQIDQLLGRHQSALDGLRNALAEMPSEESPEATELKLQLAGACFFTGDFAGLRRWIAEALEGASARGDRAMTAAATGTLGSAEYMTGDVDAARARLDEAEALIDELPDEELAGRLHSIVWCAITEMFLERFDRARGLFERTMSVASATGHGHVTALTRIGQGLVLLWRGELERGAELLDDAIEQATLTGNDQFLCWALWARCWAATLSGDGQGSLRFGRLAVMAAADSDDPLSAFAGCYFAEARFEAGDDPSSCRDQVLASLGGPEMPLVERAFEPHWLELLTRLELAAGREPEAAAWADRAAEAAAGLGIDGRSAEAERAAAELALHRGEFEAAAEHALTAAELAERPGLSIDVARAWMLAGRAKVSTDPKAAAELLERARSQLDLAGAARYRDRAASELRALGRRTVRPKRGRSEIGEGVASLSPRELEVAELVAQGHTNKEIAAELFLSEKTIESHLSRIFEKLGASKRAQVAAALQRQPAAG